MKRTGEAGAGRAGLQAGLEGWVGQPEDEICHLTREHAATGSIDKELGEGFEIGYTPTEHT
ncbi:MAG: hypothetical protein HIU91_09440 [Acidobacteria bacterium]|nr:hypothetical protein [Acidobacteriota bacterium]